MSWLTRLLNLFRRERLARELEEEMAAHVEDAIEAGRTPAEARRALGASLAYRERSLDVKLLPWLHALVSDTIFGWRQLRKHSAASTAAVLSLALAIGATTAAFRLVDAVLLRKLPVADPDSLYVLASSFVNRDGRPETLDTFDYPTYRRHRKTLENLADVVLLGGAQQVDVTFGSGNQPEKLYREYVSGNAFAVLGLQPSLGRLLTSADDITPGGHPIAVLSHDYWKTRFGRDPGVIGRRFRMAGALYEVIGVGPEGFTGSEPGAISDAFVPATMKVQALNADGWSWFRIWVRPKPGVSPEQVRQPLAAQLTAELRDRVKLFDSDTPRSVIEQTMKESVFLQSASTGVSELQRQFTRPLIILSILVALVLLIACANVGNLLAARAASRAREMALRVSIGAGQSRLIQLVLVESALLALFASGLGALFAAWSAPFVVGLLAPREDPVRLVLDLDWRVLGFGMLLAAAVTLLFGLAPALRASRVKPIAALKGGAGGHARQAVLNALTGAQVAFCVLVLFVSGLFVSTFQRLSTRPLGFTHQNLLVVEAALRDKPQPAETWRQIVDQLRQVPAVQSSAWAGWTPLSGNHWTRTVRVPGRAAEAQAPWFVEVSGEYFRAMRVGWIDGREFRPGDRAPKATGDNQLIAGVGIVNETFARVYFAGRNPVGQVVAVRQEKDLAVPMEIVGYVRDACYSNVREKIHPEVYVPIETRQNAAILLRTAGDPRAVTSLVRAEILRRRPDLRVSLIAPMTAVVDRQMIRERLLAMLSFFFAAVALALAAIGLYGVLNYGVVRRRREIGIRIALGARTVHIIRRVSASLLAVVLGGAAVGVALGIACGRFVQTLLYEVKAGDASAIAVPLLVLLAAAVLAALPPLIRSTRVDPVETLRE